MKKIFLYIRLNVFYMFRNHVRISLTLVGISLGLFVFVIGNTAVDTYIDEMYEEAYFFDENSIWIYDGGGEIIQKVKKNISDLQINRCNFTGESFLCGRGKYIYKGMEITNSVELMGVEYSLSELPIPYNGSSNILLAEADIIYGRDFFANDLIEAKNYAIIEKSTAVFLFQKENAIGEYIEVLSPYGYNRLEVIGIIDDLPSTFKDNLIFNRTIKQKQQDKYLNTLTVYTTYGYLNSMVEGDILQEKYIAQYVADAEKQEIEPLVKELNEMADLYNLDATFMSRSIMMDAIRELENAISIILKLVLGVIILISGFMIITIYMFSVKERMYEIGVRRALGASEFDIVSQFIVEGIVVAILAGVITVFISVVVCNFATIFLLNIWLFDVKFIIRKEVICAMFALATMEGIVCCLIPALVAAKTRPSEAIRWD